MSVTQYEVSDFDDVWLIWEIVTLVGIVAFVYADVNSEIVMIPSVNI